MRHTVTGPTDNGASQPVPSATESLLVWPRTVIAPELRRHLPVVVAWLYAVLLIWISITGGRAGGLHHARGHSAAEGKVAPLTRS
jgi:hypothetical protein